MNLNRSGPLFAAIVWLSATSSRGEDALARAIDQLAKKEIEVDGGVGLTIGVARGDEVLHLKGYGLADLENSVKATEKSVYRIGSITKMFTAVGVLLLVEDGSLSLDDPLTKFVPDYPSPGEKVTVRHLLNHTSGIVSFTDLPDHWNGMRKDLNHEEMLDRIRDKPFLFPPGERFEYCNSGYYLLGMIIEKASGQKYETFLQERILDSLNLAATAYDRPVKIIPNRARGYGNWGGVTVNAPFLSMNQPFAAGALFSTAGDLLRWPRALAGGQLIKPETFKQMTEPGRLNGGEATPYGFGCFVENLDDHPVIRHGGAIPGFVSELAYFPESELTVVVLSNSGRNSPRSITDQIARTFFSMKTPPLPE